MNWTSPLNHVLIPKTLDFNHFGAATNGTSISSRKKMRDKVLIRDHHTCIYCGGFYLKYLICIHKDGNYKNNDQNNLGMACRACFIISFLNLGNFREIKLYWSTMSQLEIVRKTMDYIIEKSEIPSPYEIDKNIKKAPISVLEFINILNFHPTQNHLSKYKIFFSKKLDVTFIIKNYHIQKPLFIDPESEDHVNDKENILIEEYLPSNEEINFIKKYLSDSPTN
jgi:hypothetical protein